MSDKSRRWGPYDYTYDDPIRFVDPDGQNPGAYSGDCSTCSDYDGSSGKTIVTCDYTNDKGERIATVTMKVSNDRLSEGGNSSDDGSGGGEKPPSKGKGSFASRVIKGSLVIGVGIQVVGGGPLDPAADVGTATVVTTGLLVAGVAAAADAVYSGIKWLFSQTASEDGARTAQDIISKDRKGSINKEFPDQYRSKTLDQIQKAAKAGEDGAKKALKLLRDGRFKKN